MNFSFNINSGQIAVGKLSFGVLPKPTVNRQLSEYSTSEVSAKLTPKSHGFRSSSNKALLPLFVLLMTAFAVNINGQSVPTSYINKPNNFTKSTNQIKNDKLTYLDWRPIVKDKYTDEITLYSLFFTGASYGESSTEIPKYSRRISVSSGNSIITASLTNQTYEEITSSDAAKLEDLSIIGEKIEISAEIKWYRKKPQGLVSFIPIRLNPASSKYEKLISFELITSITQGSQAKLGAAQTNNYAAESVLKTGAWYKLGVSLTGVHRIDYQTLSSMGINVNSIDPRNIRIYGNGAGMLPKSNAAFRYDDLQENAIQVIGETDGSFDGTDYILFYGESPNTWAYNSTDSRYHHSVHDYSSSTYYFLTTDGGTGSPKRIMNQNSTSGENVTVTSFDDYQYHESDIENLLKSGREWYGENYDTKTSYSFPFSFPNLVTSSPVYIKASLLGRAVLPVSSFSYSVTATGGLNMVLSGVNVGDGDYLTKLGNLDTEEATFNPSVSSFSVTVAKTVMGATGWLDYIELNARRALAMSGNQMVFRDMASVAPLNIAKYVISNATSAVQVWDVTDPITVALQQSTFSGASLTFTLPADNLKEFVAFNGNTFNTPTFVGKVTNQDIHGTIGQPELVILTHPTFLAAANDLAS